MNNAFEELKKQLGENIKEHVVLAPFTTYKVGGPADLYVIATSGVELVKIVVAAREIGIPVFILGGGSNILVGDLGFRGLVVKNNTNDITIRGMKGKVQGLTKESLVYVDADSGVAMNRLVRFTIEEGLSGLEMHLGLPGSVGGAVFMNSKWTKPAGFVGDCVYQATILTPSNKLKTVNQDYFNFSYGKSSLQSSNDILVSVVFSLKQGDKDTLWQRANESVTYRHESQPQGVKTAGCVFKNISEADALTFGTPDHIKSAGYLLDKSGCKGLQRGQVTVSTEHANFVITQTGATASDVVELIDTMKKMVKKKFNVTLKEEILRVGEFVQ